MNTLTTPVLSALLERLFTEADADTPVLHAARESMDREELFRLMQSESEYPTLYHRLKDFALPVSRETGQLLYLLARNGKARTIVEFGTSFGISTLHLAAALRDNGGGRLITTEFEPSKAERARHNLRAGGLLDLVEIREGDALQTLSADLPPSIDLLLLDGAKALYPQILALVESRLRPGAVIIADNADHCPQYLAHVRAANGGYLSMPFDVDVELSVRL